VLERDMVVVRGGEENEDDKKTKKVLVEGTGRAAHPHWRADYDRVLRCECSYLHRDYEEGGGGRKKRKGGVHPERLIPAAGV
jgi:hypothetical protein